VRKMAILLTLMWASSAVSQVPPPPVPEDQTAILETLKTAYDRKDVPLYESVLRDDVVVTIDNEVTARSKTEWLSQFGRKLSADGIIMSVKNAYQSTGRMLTIEYFNSTESFRTQTRDCCWRYDAVQYSIKENKISAISILSGGDVSRQ